MGLGSPCTKVAEQLVASGVNIGVMEPFTMPLLDHGRSEYIIVESHFDVSADVVQEHPSNPDKFKIVDFTMSK